MEKSNTGFLRNVEGRIYNILPVNHLFFAFGSFRKIENNFVGNVAILNSDLSFNLEATKKLGGGANGPVYHVVLSHDCYLVFGIFNSWAGKTVNNLVVLDQNLFPV